MNAAAEIRRARRAAGLNQVELAKRAGTSQATVSMYERGVREPSLSTLQRLLGAAGARVTIELDTQPWHRPSAEQLERRGEVLAQVIELAEALPVRHSPELRFPRLQSA